MWPKKMVAYLEHTYQSFRTKQFHNIPYASQHKPLFVCKWAIPGLERNRDGFFPHESRSDKWGKNNSSWITNGTFLLPHEWLSRRDEIKIPHERRSRSWGIFISLSLLSHSWGSKNVPFVIHEELFFPHSSLRDSWGKNPSLFFSIPGIAHTLNYANHGIPYKLE